MYWPVASRSEAAFGVSWDSARAWKAGCTAEATMQDVIKARSFFVFICGPPSCCRALRSRCELLCGGAASHGADAVDKQHCGFKLVNRRDASQKTWLSWGRWTLKRRRAEATVLFRAGQRTGAPREMVAARRESFHATAT